MKYSVEQVGEVLQIKAELDVGEALALLSRDSNGRQEVRELISQELADQVMTTLDGILEGDVEGEVKWFREDLGYGYIRTLDKTEVFVHYNGIEGKGFKTLESGQKVRFKRRMGRKSMEAIQVKPIETAES